MLRATEYSLKEPNLSPMALILSLRMYKQARCLQTGAIKLLR